MVRAPIDGVVMDVARELHPGRWIDARTQLVLVGQPALLEARGYVDGDDLERIREGGQAPPRCALDASCIRTRITLGRGSRTWGAVLADRSYSRNGRSTFLMAIPKHCCLSATTAQARALIAPTA